MRRTTVAIVTLALAGTLAFPSIAAPLFSATTDTVGGDVSLVPSDSPNGDYAYLTENDDLVVDLTAANPNAEGEGVNADAVTGLSNVFYIHYDGSLFAHVWITDGSEDVVFRARGHPIQSEANNVTLAPNGSVAVGLSVNTTGGAVDGLVDDMTVHARVAEPSDVGTASIETQSNDDFEASTTATPTSTPTTVAPTETPVTESTDAGGGTSDASQGTASPGASPSESGTPAPVAEPAGIGLQEVLGLAVFLAVVVAVVTLIRRAPWQ